MRTGKAVGVIVAALAVAGAATALVAPAVVSAAHRQAQQTRQAAGPAGPMVEKKVDTQVVTVAKPGADAPVVVRIQKADGTQPRVVVEQGGMPAIASLLGGGPRLGVQIRDVSKDDLAKMKLASQAGVIVTDVMKDSAAEKAGVKANDVVVQFDGENVRSAQQLTRLVRESVAGRAVKMAVVRDGKRMELEVAPAESADDPAVDVPINRDQLRRDIERQVEELRGQANRFRLEQRAPAPPPDSGGQQPPADALRWRMEGPFTGGTLRWYGREGGPLELLLGAGRGRLGVTVQDITPELAAHFGASDGVLVGSVVADSPAAKAGIKAGDVITTVNEKTIGSPEALVREIGDKQGEVTIGIVRDRKPMSLKATLEAPKAKVRKIIATGRPA